MADRDCVINYSRVLSTLYRCATVAAITASFSPLVGCEGKPAIVPVAGQVFIGGQPLAAGSIQFVHPSLRASGGSIGADGRFMLSCYKQGDGANVGVHKVKITAIEPINDRSQRWLAPKKYSDENTSGIEIEITEPVDDLKIELSWDGGQPYVERW